HFRRKISQQKQERIAEADLRERIFESEIGHAVIHRAEENAQGRQSESTPQRMPEQICEACAFGHAARDGVRQRHAYEERKAGLNRVVKGAAEPLGMRL